MDDGTLLDVLRGGADLLLPAALVLGTLAAAGEYRHGTILPVLVAALYATIGAAVGALVRNQTAAVAGALIWVSTVENVVPVVLRDPGLKRWLPGGAANRLLHVADPLTGGADPWPAVVALVALAAALAAPPPCPPRLPTSTDTHEPERGTPMEASVTILFLLLLAAATIFWIWALVDVARRPGASYRSGSQMVLVVAIALTHSIGAVAYVLFGRPRAAAH